MTWREALNPRRELLLLATAALEICWSYGFFALALAASGYERRGVSVFRYAALLIFAIYSARLILNLNMTLARQQAAMVALGLISILVVMRATLYGHLAPLDFSWLGRLPGAVTGLLIALSAESLVLMLGIFAWWRGLALSQAPLDFESVGFRFRWGVLMLAALALLNTFIARIDIGGLLLAFFFLGLLAVALARQEDVGRRESSVSLPLKGPWLAILGGSALLVLALGVGLAALLTPQTVRAFFDLLRPLEPVAVILLWGVLLLVSFFVELIYNLILLLIQRFASGNPNQPLLPPPPRPFIPDQVEATDLSALAAYFDPIRILCAVMLFGGILLLMALSLSRLQKARSAGAHESRESVPISLDLNPFKNLRGLFRRPHLTIDDSGVASIRRIYANLVRLATARGFPRREAETPYEFMDELRGAFPDGEAEERAITEAYVRVHYGEHDPTPAEVERIRAAWEKIKRQRSQNEG